ncbi:CaiB/BaiF CoA transferase family protein [Paracoccus sp. J56]|uniref:CaiB/BaiF CoA transferase family protein n=1 Tax=Paracoccus sp. J56 TaxID=935850 RepID=UPI000A0EBA45|nr:CoA transferase [Paracoccus sp. J56]SMG51328.1 Crotonobetainyl-CoA:carnitine CoA-transferase CaiB [Paracoccus sp. J56]
MTGALHGIRVIDVSRILGGPYAGQVLGDHGADVIKVEPPAGDDTRTWGPPFQGDTASYFLGLNRNKRAIALDLRKPEGREVLLRLLEDADVLLENYKTGTLEAWGIGHDVLAERFPRLIHCCVTGFGADGPFGGLPGYDAILQAMGGVMSVNGQADGEPTRVGLPVVDMVTGLNAVIGIMMALHERNHSGKGQYVEAALFDTSLSLLHPHAANYFLSGKVPQRSGNSHPNIAPYSTYATGTRPLYLAVGNDGQFRKLCQLIGVPGLPGDARFATNADRLINRDALRHELEAALAGFKAEELAPHLIASGVPAGPVLDVAEALALPHTEHRGMVVRKDGYRGLGAPVKLTRTGPDYRAAPPEFAQHSDEILREHGFSDQQITELRDSGVAPTRRR